MQIAEAQLEMRAAFYGGAFGQLVSGLLWLASVALAAWSGVRHGILVGLYWSEAFTTAGWLTAGLLLVFALVARQLQRREEAGAG